MNKTNRIASDVSDSQKDRPSKGLDVQGGLSPQTRRVLFWITVATAIVLGLAGLSRLYT